MDVDASVLLKCVKTKPSSNEYPLKVNIYLMCDVWCAYLLIHAHDILCKLLSKKLLGGRNAHNASINMWVNTTSNLTFIFLSTFHLFQINCVNICLASLEVLWFVSHPIIHVPTYRHEKYVCLIAVPPHRFCTLWLCLASYNFIIRISQHINVCPIVYCS